MNEKSGIRSGNHEWPCSVLVNGPTEEKMYDAIRTGPYGRCVYRCDNDVADHQVVSMRFEGGATATFTVCAFTAKCYRSIKVMGTMGEIEGDMDANVLAEYEAAMKAVTENPEFQADMAKLYYNALSADEVGVDASKEFIYNKRDMCTSLIEQAPSLDELTQ